MLAEGKEHPGEDELDTVLWQGLQGLPEIRLPRNLHLWNSSVKGEMTFICHLGPSGLLHLPLMLHICSCLVVFSSYSSR